MENRPRALPVIEVAEPCPMDWGKMRGAQGGRFCEHCQRVVHDLSVMTSDEVADLVCRDAGRLCVRFERTEDGSVRTLDYQQRHPHQGRTRRWLIVAILTSLATTVAGFAIRRKPAPPSVVMGDMIVAMPPRAALPSAKGGL
jgi:hypothetical protein